MRLYHLTLAEIDRIAAESPASVRRVGSIRQAASDEELDDCRVQLDAMRADDLPAFDIELIERPTAANALGVKGSGQAGCIAAPQTVMAAILDALSPAGVEALDMPATPERVWRALNEAPRR